MFLIPSVSYPQSLCLLVAHMQLSLEHLALNPQEILS